MASQTLTDTEKLADDIVAAIDAHTASIDSAAKERMSAELRHGEEWPSLALLLGLTSRRVSKTLKAYVAAEKALDAERADDVQPRADRDRYAAALAAQLKMIKGVVEMVFGDTTARAFQIPGEIPRDPAKLSLAGDDVKGALATKKLPAPQVTGLGKVDAKEWIEGIDTPLEALKKARAKVNQEDKELTAALAVRDKALDALSAAMVDALAFAKGAAAIAGQDHLFDGLRATIDYGSSSSGGTVPLNPVNPDSQGGSTPTRPA